MTSEDPLLNPRRCAACFQRRVLSKRNRAAFRGVAQFLRARGMGDGEKAENLADDLDVAGVVDITPT
jgi:hypothetical protein